MDQRDDIREMSKQRERIKSLYYILNVVGDIEDKFFTQYLTDLGMKNRNNKWVYKGTENEFNIIKRAVMGFIDALLPNNNISVYGKEIHKNNI